MQVTPSIELTPKHFQQIDQINNYVMSLKDLFGKLIVRINSPYEHEYESVKISEHVRKSFSFAPLFVPINTFAVDFWVDPNDVKSFELLKVYLDLEQIFRRIRHQGLLENKEYIPFLSSNKPQAIDFAIAQMYKYLSVLRENALHIYSLAAGLFYGMDSYSFDEQIRELNPDFPYITNVNEYRMESGVRFAHFLVSAAESIYSPKIGNHNSTYNSYE